ncbi:hypothetical protein Sste5346_008831 [Sporothrix stenoceras]|uniref:Zn(2)-C6 fungal-type domain-containing protein n=1 Tax=Sporothrix stenoceras TaxID=5173 RepID=A0ABR3YNY1_9PEZI
MPDSPTPTPADGTREAIDGQKRAAQDVLSERTVKRRASRACLSCRARKVRCDVLSCGLPCTNCRLDGIQCVLSDTNRGKKQSAVAARREHSPSLSSDGAVETFPMSLTFERRIDKSGRSEASYDTWETSPHYSGLRGLPSYFAGGPSPTPLSSQWHGLQLPRYIRPLPPHIGPDDIDYLAKKGATSIPDNHLRDAILRCYIQYVHPFMPAVDLASFLEPIVYDNDAGSLRAPPSESHQISLLLFQAVMFAGVAYVDVDILRERGFASRKTARMAFFERARLLYALNCEFGRLALIQALQLMTYWYEAPEYEQDTWYWMGVTLSLAQVHGFHRNPEPFSSISRQEKKLRKRMWWSCFIRDRLLALGLRRPARIRHNQKDFNVPMLTLNDFDTAPLSSDLSITFLGDLPAAHDPDTKVTLAKLCIALAKLCVCIGDVLSSQYSILGGSGSVSDPSIMVMPRRSSNEQAQGLALCDAGLDDWIKNLDDCCRYQRPQTGPMSAVEGHGQDKTHAVVRIHQTMLQMIYLTAVAALHRPQIFQPSVAAAEAPAPTSSSAAGSAASSIDTGCRSARQKVKQPAAGITEIAYDLHECNQLRFLSTSSICAFVSATLTHLLDLRFAKDFAVRNTSIGGFYQCMQALQELQQMYSSADHAVLFLESVVRHANVHIPMLAFGGGQIDEDAPPALLNKARAKTSLSAAPREPLAPPIAQSLSLSSITPLSPQTEPQGHNEAVHPVHSVHQDPHAYAHVAANANYLTSSNFGIRYSMAEVPGRTSPRAANLTADDADVSPTPASEWYDIDTSTDHQLLGSGMNFDLGPELFSMVGEQVAPMM